MWQEAAQRRKAKGIELGWWRVKIDTSQLKAIEEFYSGWIELLGKERAVDYLIVAMRKADEALRVALSESAKKKKK